MRFVTRLQRVLDLRQYLFCQMQQDLSLRGKAQRLAFANEQLEAQTLLQIAELMRQSRLCLIELGRRGLQRAGIAQRLQRP
ncbi:hypothetical protein D3C77_752130 [compost metagenome]